MFSGLMSWWIMPLVWQHWTPSTIFLKRSAAWNSFSLYCYLSIVSNEQNINSSTRYVFGSFDVGLYISKHRKIFGWSMLLSKRPSLIAWFFSYVVNGSENFLIATYLLETTCLAFIIVAWPPLAKFSSIILYSLAKLCLVNFFLLF